MVRLLVSTGEVSGDLQGSLLIRALHTEARSRGLDLEVVALGGERMRQAGSELLANTAPMGAIGLWEALPLVLPTLKLQARVEAADPLLHHDSHHSQQMRAGYGRLRQLLGDPGATRRAAAAVLDQVLASAQASA